MVDLMNLLPVYIFRFVDGCYSLCRESWIQGLPLVGLMEAGPLAAAATLLRVFHLGLAMRLLRLTYRLQRETPAEALPCHHESPHPAPSLKRHAPVLWHMWQRTRCPKPCQPRGFTCPVEVHCISLWCHRDTRRPLR